MKVYLRQFLSPQNRNIHGSVFGGDLYSLFDSAAYVAAREDYPELDFVTHSSESQFLAPLYPGDVVSVSGEVSHQPGSSAVTVSLEAHVERLGRTEAKHHAAPKGPVGKMKFVMISVRIEENQFVKVAIP
jgi:acyl-CoA hydrolase